MIVGIDEAGRGPLAGVVVACALHLKEEPPFPVRDSKALSAASREKIFTWLAHSAEFAVDIASSQEIDTHNILEATLLAFNRAIQRLLTKSPQLKDAHFIIDGLHFHNDLNLHASCIVEADKKIREVSCASIVAKVFRDHLMNSVDFLCPQWRFAKHKGYPTKEHVLLIQRHALSPFHRRSFAPCKEKVALTVERSRS